MTPEKLTDEQVENWRAILVIAFGFSPSVITREFIENYRDRVQKKFTKEVQNESGSA